MVDPNVCRLPEFHNKTFLLGLKILVFHSARLNGGFLELEEKFNRTVLLLNIAQFEKFEPKSIKIQTHFLLLIHKLTDSSLKQTRTRTERYNFLLFLVKPSIHNRSIRPNGVVLIQKLSLSGEDQMHDVE